MLKQVIASILVGTAILAVPSIPATIEAAPITYNGRMESAEQVNLFMDAITGVWYDEFGNKVLDIKPDSINGCPVVGGYKFVGKRGNGFIRIRESNGYRDMQFSRVGCWNRYLALDNKLPLQRSKQPMYADSVKGIYLGITPRKTCEILGAPDTTYPLHSSECYVYRDYGMTIEFMCGMAINITLQRGYPWKMDKSGLTCDDPISVYQQVYHFNRKPSEGAYGGYAYGTDSEYMWFDKYPQQLTLSVYNN